MALSGAWVVALVYGTIEAGREGFGGPWVLAALPGGAALLGAFVYQQRHARRPLIEVGWFSDVRFFAWATLATAVASFALFGLLFVVPQYLQTARGYSAIDTGLGLLPLMPGLGIGAALSSQLSGRLGTRTVVAAGLAILAGGLILLSTVGPTADYAFLAVGLAVAGLGTGLALAPAVDGVMSVLPADRFRARAARLSHRGGRDRRAGETCRHLRSGLAPDHGYGSRRHLLVPAGERAQKGPWWQRSLARIRSGARSRARLGPLLSGQGRGRPARAGRCRRALKALPGVHEHVARQPLLGRLATADEVARIVVTCAEHPFMTGSVVTVDGGASLVGQLGVQRAIDSARGTGGAR